MRVVACADLHLDLPFKWSTSAAASRLRQGIRASLEAALQLAVDEQADAFVLAGDVYEHDRATLDTAQFLVRVLGEFNGPVLVAPGNHDHYSSESIWATRNWPSNVHVFSEPCFKPVALSPAFTIWGAAHTQPANTPGFFDHGFVVEGGGVHLGLFHGSERLSLAFEGSNKQPHAPFSAGQIPRSGLTHAVVGHFHQAQAKEHHTYPGAASFQSFDSTPGGVVLLDFDSATLLERRWLPVEELQIHDLELDVTGYGDASSIHAACAGLVNELSGMVRVTLVGEQNPDVSLDLRTLEQSGLVVRSKVRSAYDLLGLAEEASVRGEFVRGVQAAEFTSEDERERVLVTGLRALDGRVDLEVV